MKQKKKKKKFHCYYEGRSFNVVNGDLQGALLLFTFRLLQPFKVFSLDGNTLFKSRNSICGKVGFFRYTRSEGLVNKVDERAELPLPLSRSHYISVQLKHPLSRP